jgi:capsular exopolysaccharide synthesis family protein
MTSANFAITLAQAGARVLLIDADLRRGALHNHFSAAANPGLAEVLAGTSDWFTAVIQTSIPNLHLLPCGTTPRHSHNLFAASGKFIADIAGHYDYYIFDTAPVMVADDVLSLAPHADGLLMVIRAGFTSGRIAHAALDLLRLRRVNVIGLVFNGVHPKAGDYYYYRFKEYYPQDSTM